MTSEDGTILLDKDIETDEYVLSLENGTEEFIFTKDDLIELQYMIGKILGP